MFIFLCVFIVGVFGAGATRPNIIFILADDLGWNDVGFHGSNQIPTPNIDALAVSGLMLHNYYVTPICTPSRSALMTGRYPIHNGMQHTVIYGMEPRGLPLSEKILPEYLKELGYKTHLVGKWHLGHYKREYLPLNRGFDSHLGHWTGKIDLFDHTNHERDNLWGFDFRRGFEVAHDLFGQYATDVYTNEAVRIIKSHNASEPLFLMVSHSAVHSGNPNDPLRVPDQVLDSFTNITNRQRQKYAGMMSKLDESVGKVVSSLSDNGLLANSIIVFSSDNGGPAEGFNDNAASNYPLRGVKNTLWEGGVRGAGLLWSPLLEKRSRLATQLTHIVDWLPTLYSAAGGNVSVFQDIDGFNQWDALSKDTGSERNSIVHNIDDIYGMASITIDQWKVHKGTNYKGAWDNWYGPDGRQGTYDATSVRNQLSGQALTKLGLMPTFEKILELRAAATIECNETVPLIPCNPLVAPCLYNIQQDPCELFNLADKEPEILQRLLQELDLVNKTVVPPNNKEFDLLGDPKYWGRVFTNFGDYEIPMTTLPTYDYYPNSIK